MSELDTNELRKTASERRKQLDDIAADALSSAADEIERLRAQPVEKQPHIIDTADVLDALPVGAVIRGLGRYGGVWQVTDDDEMKRYSSPVDSSYHRSNILLAHYGPFELLWSSSLP